MQVEFRQGDVGLLDVVIGVHAKAIEAAQKALEAIGVATMPVDVQDAHLKGAKDAILKERVKRTRARSDWHEDMPVEPDVVGDVTLKAEHAGVLIAACESYIAKCSKLRDAELKLAVDPSESQQRIGEASNLLHRLRGQGDLNLGAA